MSISPDKAETGTALWLRASSELQAACEALRVAQEARRLALRTMHKEGASYRDIMRQTGLSLGTVCNLIGDRPAGVDCLR